MPAVGAALSLTVILVVVLSIPLGAAPDLGLTRGQLTGWIIALCGVSGVLSLLLVWRYRQPPVLTVNTFVLVFVASLGGQLPWPELVTASMTAGAVVLLLGVLGWTQRLAAWLPVPAFSLSAIVTATPVIVALIVLQANAPSVVVLRDQGDDPPERPLTVISGLGTLAGSILRPLGVSLSLPATALTAGPDAGASSLRHRAALMAATAAVVIALLAGYASDIDTLVDRRLLVAVVGLAVVGVLIGALRQVVSGPLVLGPTFAFGIALSHLSLLGLGPFFWALAFGLATSRLVEREAWRSSQEEGAGRLPDL